MSDVVWEGTLTPEKVEYAYGLAAKMQHARNQDWADLGFQKAKERHPRMLIALEKMAEYTARAQEDQMGQTMRGSSVDFGTSRGTTEHQLCREAYRLCDEGQAIENFSWIYGSAAWLAGLNY